MKMCYLLLRTGLLNLLIILLLGCASNSVARLNSSKQTNPSYKEIAEKKFGKNVAYKFNDDRSFVLCEKVNSKSPPNPNRLKEFFVYDIINGVIIYEDKIAKAKIEWHNKTQLLITKQRGYITSPDDTGKWTYVFDLRTKKKIKNMNKNTAN